MNGMTANNGVKTEKMTTADITLAVYLRAVR